MSTSSWATIESDPGVFSELIKMLGVEGVGVEEVISFDDAVSLGRKLESYGLIFLFKYVSESDPRPVIDPYNIPSLFYAKQVVNDACATQAILSILLNSNRITKLGTMLSNFKEFTLPLDSESRGFAIGNSDDIRQAHNSFGRAEPFLQEEDNTKKRKKSSEDVYHFVAYLPFEGNVYELDGLKDGPICIGAYGADWFDVAKPAVESRIARYSQSETAFALLTVCEKRSTIIENEIVSLTNRMSELGVTTDDDGDYRQQLQSLRDELADENDKVRISLLPTRALYNSIRSHYFMHSNTYIYAYTQLNSQLKENVRRRHNYIPLILQLIKDLAKANKLQGIITNAKNKASNK